MRARGQDWNEADLVQCALCTGHPGPQYPLCLLPVYLPTTMQNYPLNTQALTQSSQHTCWHNEPSLQHIQTLFSLGQDGYKGERILGRRGVCQPSRQWCSATKNSLLRQKAQVEGAQRLVCASEVPLPGIDEQTFLSDQLQYYHTEVLSLWKYLHSFPQYFPRRCYCHIESILALPASWSAVLSQRRNVTLAICQPRTCLGTLPSLPGTWTVIPNLFHTVLQNQM